MTASEVPDVKVERTSFSSEVAPALGRLAEAALQAAAAKLSHKVDGWIRKIGEYPAAEGATEGAALEGLKAHLLGKNPVWAAMKGAWWGASVPLRLVAVLGLLLVLLLAPEVLLLVLLGLLVAAIVVGIRAATR